MIVYRSRSSWMDDERLNVPTMTVHASEGGRRNTGLLDASGAPIYVFEDMDPIGFVHSFEKQEIHMAKKPAKPMKPMSKPSNGGKKGC